MYIPKKFKVEDPTKIRSFVEENSFGLLLSYDGSIIQDTHTPFVYSEDGTRLLGHLARANSQWQSWKTNPGVKVIFSGPHTYISPHYYVSEFAVPTWNYTAVSITGSIEIIEAESAVLAFLDRLTGAYEAAENPWVLDRNDERYMKLLLGVVVFAVTIESVEASFKMNQNKSEEDQRSVIHKLSESRCPMDQQVAQIMADNLSNKENNHEPN